MVDNLSQLIQKQETIYSFLQGIYEKEVNKQCLAEMPEKMKPLAAVAELLSDKKSKILVEEFIKFCSSIPSQQLDTVETQLAADYARLFLSLNKVPAHPSESTYREGTMMMHHRDEVLEVYWSFGMTAGQEFTEPEDHIATELSFMAFLCKKTNQAFKKGDIKKAKEYAEAQKNFLANHLIKWVPKLVKDVLQYSHTPFYKGIAVLTDEFLKISLSSADDILKGIGG